MNNKWINLIKKESVFVLSGLAAMLSALFVPPSVAYFGYIDYKIIAILFCLMAVVAGIQRIGTFEVLSQKLLKKGSSVRTISLILVSLCFFMAMLVTNDVALITMVPFTLAILDFLSEKRIIFILVMETIAANLGSMLTPVGNPQNLYLFSYFHLSVGQFLKLTLPITALSLVLILIITIAVRGQKLNIVFDVEAAIQCKLRLSTYIALFFVCLLTVVGLLDFRMMLTVVVFVLFLLDKKIFREVDYFLLITFVFFFIFVGNVSQITVIDQTLSKIISGRELISGVLLSQVISNVPAAVMLSSFAHDSKGLILGVDIGGLGTLVASLASLITYKIYSQRKAANIKLYLLVFTALNILFLMILIAAVLFFDSFRL